VISAERVSSSWLLCPLGDLGAGEVGVTRQTLYRYAGPAGELREDGRKLLQRPRR
jgi:hypothetical protein